MEGPSSGGLTRKEMLKLSALGGAALVLPIQRVAQTQLSIDDRMPESQLPRPFSVPLQIPPVLRPVKRDNRKNIDYYSIVMKASRVQILPDGPKTYIFGYNGITPGPTIEEERGRSASCGTSTVSRRRTRTSATSARPPCTCTARTLGPSTTAGPTT